MGARTTYYDPGRMYMPNGDPGYPPEWEGEITSDISGDVIEDWDNIWQNPDGNICSYSEALEGFLDDYATELTDPKDIETAKKYIEDELGYTSEEINKMKTFYRIEIHGKITYESESTLDLNDYDDWWNNSYCRVNPDGINWDSDDYEPDDTDI